MIEERSFAKGAFVFAACFLIPLASAIAGAPGPKRPVGFTLVVAANDPGPIAFTLAPGLKESSRPASLGGMEVVEDPAWPYRTALGSGTFGFGNTGEGDTAIGYQALNRFEEGTYNTATGYAALYFCVGSYNTANGAYALAGRAGSYNTAIGSFAISSPNSMSTWNTAVGAYSLGVPNDSWENVAVGPKTLTRLRFSEGNIAIGYGAFEIPEGSTADSWADNIAIGRGAGSSIIDWANYRPARYNIFIGGHQWGVIGDTNTIRIGTPYSGGGQNRTFISGIVETPFTSSDAPSVVGITSEGRLGTVSSDLLPEGPQGPQGLPGEGLASGALLFLPSGYAPPAGYAFLGSTEIVLSKTLAMTLGPAPGPGRPAPGVKRQTKLTVNVYQKQ